LKLKKKDVFKKSSQIDQQNHELSLKNQQIQQLTFEIDHYKNESDDVISGLRHQLLKAQQEVSNRNRQIVRLDEEVLKIKEDADKMRKDLEKRYENIDLLKSNYKEREAQFDAAKKMVDKLKSDQTEMVADRDKLSKMLAISREREINSQQRVTQCQKELETLYNELDDLRIASEQVGSCAEEKEEEVVCLKAQIKNLEKQRVVMETKFNEECLKMQRASETQNDLHQLEIEQLMKRNSELICKTSHQGSDEDPLTSAIDAKDVEILRLNQLIHLKNGEISRLQFQLTNENSANISRRRSPHKAPQSNLKIINQSEDTFDLSDRFNSIKIRNSPKKTLFITSSPNKESLIQDEDTEDSLYERVFGKYEDISRSSSSPKRLNQQNTIDNETRRILTRNRIERLKNSK